MATTNVTICNLALGHIKKKTITSLTESSENARQCNLVFETTRDAVLRAHSWNFATKIVSLVEIANEDVPGWNYLYAMPSKCIYVRKVYSDITLSNPVNENHKELISPDTNVKAIVANISPAYCEYTYQVTDASLFDPVFVEALGFKLGAVLAPVLTGSASMGDKMLQIYNMIIDQAKTVNSSEGYLPQQKTSTFIDSRG